MSAVTETEKKPALAGEQAADFAALQRSVSDAEAVAATAGAEAEQAAPRTSIAEEIGGALTMIMAMLKPALPNVAEIYTPEVVGSVGAVVEAVCNKHGWLQDGLMGEWGEEISALIVIGPLAYATYQAACVDIDALKKRKGDGKAKPQELPKPEVREPQHVTLGTPAAVSA